MSSGPPLRIGIVSKNDLLETALRNELAAHQCADIDSAFSHMIDDHAYQREAVEIAGEFESSDWEALRLSESLETGRLP
ncbi:MAG TPA: CopG family transcriptional regulator [Thermoanaerobaculia bacterium]|nr:CopG family transcriptional regulator [Thermoanaerobaculia bacterium]